ncbi:hypothetical protein ANCCAN_02402 [Ancylostoma caninum]|uniref:Uncharacterized protein n=1 Tax=Ancylostoma caninum TaxID=29170 RepID=A0A368H4B5_ANCCA|nr:hypothetical protein ANCCAN_02402 [Ancylostoma caninum]
MEQEKSKRKTKLTEDRGEGIEGTSKSASGPKVKRKEKVSAYERAKRVYEQIQEQKQQERLLRKQEKERRQIAYEKYEKTKKKINYPVLKRGLNPVAANSPQECKF